MTDFGLTTAGLTTPRMADARELVVAAWRERFGSSVTSSDSPDGLMIDTVALFVTLAWQGLASVYANSFFRTAKGQSLNLIVDEFGTEPLQPTPSTAEVVWFGTAGTVVLASRIAAVEDTAARFVVDSDTTLQAFAAAPQGVVRINAVVNANTYQVTSGIDTAPYVAQPGDTVADVAEGVRDAILNGTGSTSAWVGAACSAVFETPDGDAVFFVESLPAAAFNTTGSTNAANIQVFPASRVPMTCESDGPTPAFAGELNTIVTAVAGIEGVFNPLDAELGRNLETPEQLRVRHLQTLNRRSQHTVDAIRAAVLDVDGVINCRVFNNPTDAVDVNGVPAHSFEVVVLGGEDAAIAAAIFSKQPAGIQAFGSTVVQVTDASGMLQPIGFSRATVRYLHLRITATAGEGYTASGDNAAAIQAAVVADLDAYLTLGTNVYRLRVARLADTTVAGLASVLVETDDTTLPGDAPAFSNADILTPEDTVLMVDSSRVEVILA